MIEEKNIKYQDGSTECHAFVAIPKTHKTQTPCVMVAHDWSGQNDFARDKARAMAEMGYVGFAVDMYGKGQTGKDTDQKSALMMPLIEDRKALSSRINAALQVASDLPEVDEQNIAIMGFCFGGLCGLDLARSGADIKGVISFHGLLFPPSETQCVKMKAKVLVLHGYDDPMCPPEHLDKFAEEMTGRGVDWQIQAYGNTKHAFTNPDANDTSLGLQYNQIAKDRSWTAATNFLTELFC